jgi:hypothetical protein
MYSLSHLTRAALTAALASAALAAGAQTAATPATQPAPGAAMDRATVESAFTKADVNKDGKVTKDEVAKLPALAAKFVELDKDKDGALSMDEFATGYTAKN